MEKSRKIPSVNEVSKEELQELCRNVFDIYAMLETAAIALYNLQNETEPLSKAVTIGFAVENAARGCENVREALEELSNKVK